MLTIKVPKITDTTEKDKRFGVHKYNVEDKDQPQWIKDLFALTAGDKFECPVRGGKKRLCEVKFVYRWQVAVSPIDQPFRVRKTQNAQERYADDNFISICKRGGVEDIVSHFTTYNSRYRTRIIKHLSEHIVWKKDCEHCQFRFSCLTEN